MPGNKKGVGGTPAKKIRDKRDGTLYVSIKQASIALGISPTSIELFVRGRLKRPRTDLSFIELVRD